MGSLFYKTGGKFNINKILKRMEKNCSKPASNSKALWKLRHATRIKSDNKRTEIMLEKSVAMLAKNEHMSDWFNQCPTASGIVCSNSDKKRSVDLVRWNVTDKSACLIELKCGSDNPCKAIKQILRYGAAYLYCRKHRDKLPVKDRPILDARQITLCVLAPAHFYGSDSKIEKCFKKAQEGLREFNAKPLIAGMSMSIKVLSFPESFSALLFANGAEVKESCNQVDPTDKGQQIRDAFNGLVTVCE